MSAILEAKLQYCQKAVIYWENEADQYMRGSASWKECKQKANKWDNECRRIAALLDG